MERHTCREDVKTQGEDSHPQPKERGLEQAPSQPSEGINLTSTLSLDFRTLRQQTSII